MRSLRLQLLLGTALGTTLVLLVSSLVLYALIGHTLRDEFDRALAAKARYMATLIEQEHEGLESELVEKPLPEFEPSDHAEYYQVWLSDGAVFARSPSLQGGDLDRIQDISQDFVFRSVQLPSGRMGRIVGMTFVPRREHQWESPATSTQVTLVVGREFSTLQATLARVRNTLFIVCLAAVVLSAIVLAWVLRRGLKPIEHLGRQIAAVGENDLSARIMSAGVPDELSPVVDRLNDLLARLAAAFERERRFTGDVAHELRTPLAGVRSMLEVALSRDRDAEAYRKSMRDCLGITLHMQRMVENLLQLARADAGQLEVRREPVDLSALIRECWQPFQVKADQRDLSIEWRLDGSWTLETDRDLLRLVLQNVLDNAVAHADKGGSISIAIADESERKDESEGGSVSLTVTNTGSRLSPADLEHVFDRFWRGDSSYSSSETRCGLGLSLCKTLLDQLGGTIQAATTDQSVFVITVRHPRAG